MHKWGRSRYQFVGLAPYKTMFHFSSKYVECEYTLAQVVSDTGRDAIHAKCGPHSLQSNVLFEEQQ